MSKNYYQVLGVGKDSSADEIKKSYRQLALKYHPDKNPGDKASEDKFKEVAEAYDILSNPDKKKKYDSNTNSNPFGYNSYKGNPFRSDGFNWSSFFGEEPINYNKKGVSLSVNISISIVEMVLGVKKKIKLKRYIKCSSCSGNGSKGGTSFQTCHNCAGTGYLSRSQSRGFAQIQTTIPCHYCSGTGKVVLEVCENCFGENGLKIIEEIVDITIPAGAIPGMKFEIKGKRNEGKDTTEPGDLIVRITEIEDATYFRSGTDLKIVKEVSFLDAVLGAKLPVLAPDGEYITTVVESGTKSGTILQFPGKGIPNYGYGSRGDFLVQIQIKIPVIEKPEDIEFLTGLKNNDIFK